MGDPSPLLLLSLTTVLVPFFFVDSRSFGWVISPSSSSSLAWVLFGEEVFIGETDTPIVLSDVFLGVRLTVDEVLDVRCGDVAASLEEK